MKAMTTLTILTIIFWGVASRSPRLLAVGCSEGCPTTLRAERWLVGDWNCRWFEEFHCTRDSYDRVENIKEGSEVSCVIKAPTNAIKVYMTTCEELCDEFLPADSREMRPPAHLSDDNSEYVGTTNQKDCL